MTYSPRAINSLLLPHFALKASLSVPMSWRTHYLERAKNSYTVGKFDDPDSELTPPWPKGVTSERPKIVPLRKGNGEAKPDEPPIPTGESAFSLTERNIPEPVKLCDPWAIEGVDIIASRPKLGKTTLMRQMLAAAGTATEYLDSKFDHAVKCAFLSLEEGELLCRAKFKMAGFTEDALASIQLFFDWPRGDAGVSLLDRYLSANRDVRMVCVDSLTKFRHVPDVRMPGFIADYEAMSALHSMSKSHPGVCFKVVHHTRKSKSEDPIDDISGTYGLTAACDSYVVLRHHADGAAMWVGGRLWPREESSFILRRAAQRWQMLGLNLGLTDKQAEALEMVKAAFSVGLSGKEMADKLSITVPSAWQRLDELLEKGLVSKRFGRVYAKG